MSETENTENIGFADLGLRPELLDALMELGYEEPTPIQRESIPRLLEGRDLLGQAATGTGKTAAFALPILERVMDSDRTAPTALVLVPTRELAMQVSEAVHRYGRAAGDDQSHAHWCGIASIESRGRAGRLPVGKPAARCWLGTTNRSRYFRWMLTLQCSVVDPVAIRRRSGRRSSDSRWR